MSDDTFFILLSVFGGLVLIFVVFVIFKDIFLRVKESQRMLLVISKLMSNSIEIISAKNRKVKGIYNGHKLEIELVPHRGGDCTIHISFHGNYPKQNIILLRYPELGEEIYLCGNALFYTVPLEYGHTCEYLAEKYIRKVEQMSSIAKGLENK